jgi:hypothetical protein
MEKILSILLTLQCMTSQIYLKVISKLELRAIKHISFLI